MIRTLICLLALGLSPLAQDLVPRGRAEPGPVLLVNAEIHPVSQPAIARGWLRFEGATIVDLGAGDPPEAASAGATVHDLAGQQLWPGLIAAHSGLGLEEIENIRPSTDFNEVGEVTPEAIAALAVNPDSTLLPVARASGILTAGVFPTGGVIPGRASLMALDGWTWREMAVVEDAALIVQWPRQDIIRAPWMDLSEEDQRKRQRTELQAIERAFEEAKAYHAARRADERHPLDLNREGYAAFLPEVRADGALLPPRRPVFFFAQRAAQIRGALAFAARLGLKAVIVGGDDAEDCAPELIARDVPVLVLGTLRTPRRDDAPYDHAYTLPARLAAKGVRFAIGSADSNGHQRFLAHHAGMAAAHGLAPEHAMRAVTLEVARIYGVEDRLGALEKGRLATLMVTDGDPLEVTTEVTRAWIGGRRTVLESKQSALRDKYRERSAR